MTSHRVRAGDDVAITIAQSDNTGIWSAIMTDAVGNQMNATATAVTGGVQVSVAASEWKNGLPGVGRAEIKRVSGGSVTYPAAVQVRILPGIAAGRVTKDYV